MQRLRPASMIAVPVWEGAGQCSGTSQFNRPNPQGVTPCDLAKVPAREHHRIVDHHDKIFLAAWIPLADLGVTPLDKQPAATAGPRQGRVVEAHQGPALRQPVAVDEECRPHPQHYAGVSLFWVSDPPTWIPSAEVQP